MNKRPLIAFAALLLIVAAPAIADHHGKAGKNIVEVAQEAGQFNTLIAAVQAAGLADTLATGGPFTVFAPTDEAFAKIPEDQLAAILEDTETLTAILTYHVVSGVVRAEQVVGLDSATTLQGSDITITVSDAGVSVDGAQVIATDIEASNGVIHVIDTVITP
ncbi:MAG: fasciclin domain-containing protein [Wenzhouxiangella sp.]|nr:MAG: fasciclin domain-containing protein [Wenzhouxiangella sp.]